MMHSPKRSMSLVVAALLVAACTSGAVDDSTAEILPPPSTSVAAPPTTEANATVRSGAQALAWSAAFEVPDPFDIRSIVWASGSFYALGSERADYYAPSAMWTSRDGFAWTAIDIEGSFGEDAVIHSLAGSDQGLLALGFLPSGDSHAASAWFSDNGEEWESAELGYLVGPSSQPFVIPLLVYEAAAVGPAGAVVSASAFPSLDWTAAQQAAVNVLPEELAGIDPTRVHTSPETVQVVVGPFSVFSESLADLGLDDLEEAQRLTNSPGAATQEVGFTFFSGDLEQWSMTEGRPGDADYVAAIAAIGDEYLAVGFGSSYQDQVFASSDGQAWEPVSDLGDGTGGLFALGERVITDGWQGSQRVTRISDDHGRTWEQVPGPDLTVSWMRAAGAAGVLGTGTDGEFGWGATPEPETVRVDGYTVVFDEMAQEFTVTDGGGTEVLAIALEMDDPMWGWGFAAPDALVFDYPAETVDVLDPVSGDPFLTLSFANLDRLASGMISYAGEVVTFSPDAEQWTVTPMEEAFGPDSMVGPASVGPDRVVAVIFQTLPDPYSDSTIWVGTPVSAEAAATAAVPGEAPLVVMGGPTLNWEKAADLEHDVRSMAVTTTGVWAIAGERSERGVLWYSPDGLAWTQLDVAALFGEGVDIDQFVGGGPGLVAVGSRPSGEGREVTVWTSSDGEEWTASSTGITTPAPTQPFEMADLHIWESAAGTSGAVFVAEEGRGVDFRQLEPNVQSALPAALREFATGMGVMIDPWQISVQVGPFQVFSEDVEDLDVNRDLFDAYERSVQGSTSRRAFLLVFDDYESWQQLDDWAGADSPPGALTATDSGFLAATWEWGADSRLLRSADGLTWVEADGPADSRMIRWFGTDDSRLLMLGEQAGAAVLWESTDGGVTWTPYSALPEGSWEVRAGGLGLVASGEHESSWWDPVGWPPTVITSAGYTMTVESGRDGLSITDAAGAAVVSADLSAAGMHPEGLRMPDFIVADHERGEFTVLDPDSSEILMRVTYREMQDAFDAARESAGSGPDTFVAYSADGQVWSEQSIRDVAGMAGWINELAVSEDFVVLVVHGQDNTTTVWRGTP